MQIHKYSFEPGVAPSQLIAAAKSPRESLMNPDRQGGALFRFFKAILDKESDSGLERQYSYELQVKNQLNSMQWALSSLVPVESFCQHGRKGRPSI
jgi:hypothetical protein